MTQTFIVSYVKHFDNETKGTLEYTANTLCYAVERAAVQLISDALDAGVDADADPAHLFTITKAELAQQGTNWTGVPKAGF